MLSKHVAKMIVFDADVILHCISRKPILLCILKRQLLSNIYDSVCSCVNRTANRKCFGKYFHCFARGAKEFLKNSIFVKNKWKKSPYLRAVYFRFVRMVAGSRIQVNVSIFLGINDSKNQFVFELSFLFGK